MFRLRGIYKLNVLVTSYQTVDWNLSDGKRSRSCVQLVHHRVYGSNVMSYMHPAWLLTGHADDGPRSSQGIGAVVPKCNSKSTKSSGSGSFHTQSERSASVSNVAIQIHSIRRNGSKWMLAKALRSNENNHLVRILKINANGSETLHLNRFYRKQLPSVDE